MPGKDIQPHPPREWLTSAEAAELVRVHPKTIERACRRGALEAVRPGRGWIVNRRSLLKVWEESLAARPDLKKRTAKGDARKYRAPLRRATKS